MVIANSSVQFDLLVRSDRIYDSVGKRFYQGQIGVNDGKIAAILGAEASARAKETIDAQGRIVLPGFIDFHTHVYWGGTPLGINAEKVGPYTGVTTFVDQGSSGSGNFEGFYHQIIKRANIRILAFLNLSYIGLVSIGNTTERFGELYDLRLIDEQAFIETVRCYTEVIKGVKIRLGPNTSGGNDKQILEKATGIAKKLRLPLVVHATTSPPQLKEVLSFLGEGDVLTHCFIDEPNQGILHSNGLLKDLVHEARSRGVLFDIGHGVSCFSFKVAKLAIEQGFLPDFISSDIHAYSINGPAYDLPTTLAKFRAIGVSDEEIFSRVTLIPARALKMEKQLGSLTTGKTADFSIVHWLDSSNIFFDAALNQEVGKILKVDQTFYSGKVIEPVVDEREEAKWKPGVPEIFKHKKHDYGRGDEASVRHEVF